MNYQNIVEAVGQILNGSLANKSNYMTDPAGYLITIGIVDPAEQKTINELLIAAEELRQRQIKTYNQFTDYQKKMQVLYTLVNDRNEAALFYGAPDQYLNKQGVLTQDDRQQILDLLIPINEFQQLMVRYRQDGMDYTKKIACLRKLLTDNDEKEKYKSNPSVYLASNGVVTAADQGVIIDLLYPAEILQKELIKKDLDNRAEVDAVNSSYRQGLSKANHQTVSGFHTTMVMYIVSFYLGVALLVTAIVFAIVAKSSLFTIIFGSIGTLDLLTFFITKPPLSLQASRSEQAKLNAAFYSWFLDLMNWNAFYLQYSQVGQTIDFDVMKNVSEAQIGNTQKLMEIISDNIHLNTAKE